MTIMLTINSNLISHLQAYGLLMSSFLYTCDMREALILSSAAVSFSPHVVSLWYISFLLTYWVTLRDKIRATPYQIALHSLERIQTVQATDIHILLLVKILTKKKKNSWAFIANSLESTFSCEHLLECILKVRLVDHSHQHPDVTESSK